MNCSSGLWWNRDVIASPGEFAAPTSMLRVGPYRLNLVPRLLTHSE
jgi:hypothetical protein